MIAILSDIHGNIHALEAVLADMPSPTEIWVLGDISGGGPFPCEVLDRLMSLPVPISAIMGNWEEGLIKEKESSTPPPEGKQFAGPSWSISMLKPHHWDFFSKLPRTIRSSSVPGGALLFHGSPDDPSGKVICQQSAEEVLAKHSEKWLIGGHSHEFRLFRNKAQTFAGISSVGWPLDGVGGVASYALLDRDKITFRSVSYDVDAVIAAMRDGPLATLAPAVTRALAAIALTGQRYIDGPKGILTFAQDYAQKRLGHETTEIPPDIWEEVELLWRPEPWLREKITW